MDLGHGFGAAEELGGVGIGLSCRLGSLEVAQFLEHFGEWPATASAGGQSFRAIVQLQEQEVVFLLDRTPCWQMMVILRCRMKVVDLRRAAGLHQVGDVG